MPLSLPKDLRNQLSRITLAAREKAESAAKATLENLAVHEADYRSHMSVDVRILRNKLRARGRALGDKKDDTKDTQEIRHLIELVAYENWHRLLFTRFLTENNLLISDEENGSVPVTLADCDELAASLGARDGFELACRFAARILPGVFRSDDPALEVALAPNDRVALKKLLDELPAELFRADDSLGWTYQFWQAKRKDEVNASGKKIGADEISPVTQLFTEDYMVEFLLHNTIGAWWAGKKSSGNGISVKASAEEIDARRSVGLSIKGIMPGIEWTYLRFCLTPKYDLTPKSPLHEWRGDLKNENGAGQVVHPPRKKPVTSRNFVSAEKLEIARSFRKEPTPKEAEVWEWLRDRQMLNLKWRRQQVIEGFIADFYCAEHHLALEIDGGIHNTDQARLYDDARDQIFIEKDITTIRIENSKCTKENIESTLKHFLTTSSSVSVTPFSIHGEGGRGDEVWVPAAGTFEGWPKTAKEIRFLDPCMGSGHFIVFALPIIARLRMEEEGLNAAKAVYATLKDNIFGLEIDERCTQIAAFNVALTAWKIGGYQKLPQLHLACSGIAPQAKLQDWVKLAGDDDKAKRGMERLYKLFEQAPILGSLIDPTHDGDLLTAGFDELKPLFEKALKDEKADENKHEMAVSAQGIEKAAEILSGKFTVVGTNVPYLARGKQQEVLADFCEKYYSEAKNDLATVFLQRCLEFCIHGTSTSVVLPQNWLFLTSYRKFREMLLKVETWVMIGRLGAHGFQTPMWDFNVQLIALTRGLAKKSEPVIRGIDVSEPRSAEEKAATLIDGELKTVKQKQQLHNPDSVLIFADTIGIKRLSDYTFCTQGIATGDLPRFVGKFWELVEIWPRWEFMQLSTNSTQHYDGRNAVLLWDENCGYMASSSQARIQGQQAWGKKGLAIRLMSELPCSLYSGAFFDQSNSPIIPFLEKDLIALWCYCSSKMFSESVRTVDQALSVTEGNLLKVPFDLPHWNKVASDLYPHGLPHPFSDDPTQWIFHGHPCGSVIWDEHKKKLAHGKLRTDKTVLQIAIARLLGYTWPAEAPLAIHGEVWGGEDAPLAIHGEGRGGEVMELASEQREWVKKTKPLLKHADTDGIVCLLGLNREQPAASRLRALLGDAYDGHFDERALIASTGSDKATLEEWLRDEFFEQHCAMFHHRPFIWHIWDGRKDGFHVLVNYHKLDHDNLQKLTYSYLGDWIRKQDDEVKSDKPGAAERLGAAKALQEELANILKGEPPYDIFVRWKLIAQQSIGWHPDINDGVRLNIRPFLKATDVGKKGAGVLRTKPNIKWEKDRGTEPLRDKKEFPWFWCAEEPGTDPAGGKVFAGNRWNDVHLSGELKTKAKHT